MCFVGVVDCALCAALLSCLERTVHCGHRVLCRWSSKALPHINEAAALAWMHSRVVFRCTALCCVVFVLRCCWSDCFGYALNQCCVYFLLLE